MAYFDPRKAPVESTELKLKLVGQEDACISGKGSRFLQASGPGFEAKLVQSCSHDAGAGIVDYPVACQWL